MLVVIAVIGVMVTICVGYLTGDHRSAITQVRDRRNAQEVVAITMGATAAGASVIVPGDWESTIQNLLEGREASRGNFKGKMFRIGNFSEDEISAALPYLGWEDEHPVYIYETP